VPNAQGSILDPSTTVDAGPAGMSTKMGLDATRPLDRKDHVFTTVAIPGEDEVDVQSLLARGVDAETRALLGL
jgi:2,5-furandicarboxylate decarboxylase 1